MTDVVQLRRDALGPVRVLLANDVQLIVEGLKALLAPYAPRIVVVGTATGDPEIVREAETTPEADVLLIGRVLPVRRWHRCGQGGAVDQTSVRSCRVHRDR